MLPEGVRAHVRRIFEGVSEDLRPHRLTFPDATVVLHFAHPGMAAQHAERMHALAEASGRTVHIHPHPNHQRLSELVHAHLPTGWEVLKTPACVPQEDAVRVLVWTLPPEAERREVASAVQQALGCRLLVARGD